MSSLATKLDLAVRTHAAARHLRLVSTRVRAAEAIGLLCDEAARELPALSPLKRAALNRAIEAAVNELKASVGEAARERECS